MHPAFDAPQSRELPMFACLEVLRESLELITQGNSILSQTKQETEPRVVRLQHRVSHPVDPLCWLHAQRGDSRHPTVYFANAEQTLESAVFGSAYTHHDSANQDFWNLVRKLPPESRIYGGERFDPDMSPSPEWQDFGAGYWVLPAVELKRVAHAAQSNHEEEFPTRPPKEVTTTLSLHLYFWNDESLRHAAQECLDILQRLSDSVSHAVAPTTLPPVISRESSYGPKMDGQEIYEAGVAAALQEFEAETLQKVVLARRMDLNFDSSAKLSGLDMLRKWKYGGHEGGHLFYLNPGGGDKEFVGCTPERLFHVQDGQVTSEALAGTRPRGSTHEADAQLSRDLFQSPKDREENLITGRVIRDAFQEMYSRDWLTTRMSLSGNVGELFVRRLRHLQHICQRFRGTLSTKVNPVDVSRFCLETLHPTPAVGGLPEQDAMQFIREKESFAFDRGFYAGPFGCFGSDTADVVVAIRSGLLTRPTTTGSSTSISVYAGAGLVPGSTVQEEWSETSYKLGVVSSLFPQSPLSLQTAATPNVAWANAFIEELIRCRVTQFYVCPGSRSTPLVAALAKSLRANVGVVHAISVHDERSAAFHALGYGRASSGPAAVITSSGTAVSNLYPAIVEAGMDGVPMLLVTADRPYENRATGANQAIDQVKSFSSTYIRWFRDIPPPSDDVPVSVALSDAGHGVDLSRKLRGPVHFNIQFRENLAPDTGPIRNDNRVDSIMTFNGARFTDVPGYHRWVTGGDKWLKSFSGNDVSYSVGSGHVVGEAIDEIAQLFLRSKRGLIVVGNLRSSTDNAEQDSQLVDVISNFAEAVGFPIIAGVQSGGLRFGSSAVIPFAEHLLKTPLVSENIKADFVLQIGSPLVSTEVANVISLSMKEGPMHHVLLHPHHPQERADPNFTISHRVSSNITPFLKGLLSHLKALGKDDTKCSSDLAPLVLLGRQLQEKMPDIIHDASRKISSKFESSAIDGESIEVQGARSQLSEPQVALAVAQIMSKSDVPLSLFLSNSMPVRDAEFFLYPTGSVNDNRRGRQGLCSVGVNRGASGIDGIISSASGFAEASDKPTTLLVGDLAALHDINALHTLSRNTRSPHTSGKRAPALTTVVVNNDGGGIFSFLPIAKHGKDVNFDEFFGTPTNSFSYERGTAAFGLEFSRSTSFESFLVAYDKALLLDAPSVVEAQVTGRNENVAVHQEITRQVTNFVTSNLDHTEAAPVAPAHRLPVKRYGDASAALLSEEQVDRKTLLLLHGWMGQKTDWDIVGEKLARSLSPEWSVISVDLPGHGDSVLVGSSDTQVLRAALGLTNSDEECDAGLAVSDMAATILRQLNDQYNISSLDAIAGYSLGGRVGLSMKRLSETSPRDALFRAVVTQKTKLILLSADPGEVSSLGEPSTRNAIAATRSAKDGVLSRDMVNICNRGYLVSENALSWSGFLEKWYKAPLWGGMRERDFESYQAMLRKKEASLAVRGRDLAAVLLKCSPGNQRSNDLKFVNPDRTLYLAGALDEKYSGIAQALRASFNDLNCIELAGAGHALLVESPQDIASITTDFLMDEIRRETVTKPEPLRELSVGTMTMANATDGVDIVLDEVNSFGGIGAIEYESFTISIEDGNEKEIGISGIGWGDKAKQDTANRLSERSGLILNIVSSDGCAVGIGEVSPLAGLHPETLERAETQMDEIRSRLQHTSTSLLPLFDAERILALDGSFDQYIHALQEVLNIKELLGSVRSGLEMALLSLASQMVRMPLLQALTQFSPGKGSSLKRSSSNTLLPINGLVMRGRATYLLPSRAFGGSIVYPSLKVKVGHQTAKEDAVSMSIALQETEKEGKIRVDANRAWDEESALQFAAALEELDTDVVSRLEFIEEPLQKMAGEWSLKKQIQALERWHIRSGIPYALDESLADLATAHGGSFEAMHKDIAEAFAENPVGCAAFVLKPSLLGLELSMQLARMAHKDLVIGAVFSSSFDSGVGLAYAAFLGATADSGALSPGKTLYSHGVGTFSMLAGDTLSPSFASYVTDQGQLKVASLSRAFFGLGLDDMRDSSAIELPEVGESPRMLSSSSSEPSSEVPDYRASSATSSSGREISLVVSLPLPFSDDIACSRFADLPQQSRWSPWLSSVAYLEAGSETEWTLNVRGVRFSWRAVSSLLENPYRGIKWESISGLKNMGVVEFIPNGPDSCTMNVRMTIVTPRIVATLFPGASMFAEDFLQNKLLKWSLEMFRDVVKGDLAVERGDVELGDALFGAVEGRANAIEASLSYPLLKDSGGDKATD